MFTQLSKRVTLFTHYEGVIKSAYKDLLKKNCLVIAIWRRSNNVQRN